MPKLLIQEGGQQSVFELFDDEVTVGRGAANVIQVADQRSSKHHAVVRRIHGRPKLIDFESRNGTRVNGEFQNQRWLEHGDVISIGEMTMTYDASDVAAAAPAARVPAAPVAVAAAPRPVAAAPAVTIHRRAGGPQARSSHARSHDDDDEQRGPRHVPKRRDNSIAVAALVGAGLILAVFLLFKVMGSAGTSNASTLAYAKRLADKDVAKGVAYLEEHGDPSDVDGYKSVEEQIKEWKELIQDQNRQGKEEEGRYALERIHRNVVEQHKNGMTDAQLGQALLTWAETYPGTIKHMELMNSQNAPFPQLRGLMEKAKQK